MHSSFWMRLVCLSVNVHSRLYVQHRTRLLHWQVLQYVLAYTEKMKSDPDLPFLPDVTVTPNVIRAGSNQTITVQFNQPLPFTFTSDPFFGTTTGKRSILASTSTNPTISCRFGSASVAAVPNSSNNPDSFTCQSPVILQEGNLPFTVLWNGNPLVESVDFQITSTYHFWCYKAGILILFV